MELKIKYVIKAMELKMRHQPLSEEQQYRYDHRFDQATVATSSKEQKEITPDDVLVKTGVVPDDNYNVIAAHDGSRVYVDKDSPRTEIYIEKIELFYTFAKNFEILLVEDHNIHKIKNLLDKDDDFKSEFVSCDYFINRNSNDIFSDGSRRTAIVRWYSIFSGNHSFSKARFD